MPAVHSVTRGLVQVPADGVHDEQPDRHRELHHDAPALPRADTGGEDDVFDHHDDFGSDRGQQLLFALVAIT